MKQTLTLSLVLPTLISSSAFGAGFQLQEASAIGLGRAFSAEASIADDASILAANPAGIVLLDGTSFSVSASYIRPTADVTGTFTGGATTGTIPANSKNVGEDVVVPALYLTHKLNDKVSLGVGTFTTYGLATDYESSFGGLTIADESSLESVNFQPTIAYRVNDQFSIGAGFNVLYADGTLNSSFPAGTPGLGGATILELEGDDFGYGYNIGFLYEVNQGTRFGLHYRSKVDLTLEGTTDFIGSAAAMAPGFVNAPTTLSVSLPETLQVSVYHELNHKWAIHGDAKWTAWSRYDGLSPQVPSSPVATSAADSPADWDNAMRYSIGVTHHYSDKLTLRGGIAYDESPVSNPDRTLRIPDEDRVWLTFGFSYALSEKMNLDFGYAHIFIDDGVISDENSTGVFNGKVSGDVDIVSIGLSGKF